MLLQQTDGKNRLVSGNWMMRGGTVTVSTPYLGDKTFGLVDFHAPVSAPCYLLPTLLQNRSKRRRYELLDIIAKYVLTGSINC